MSIERAKKRSKDLRDTSDESLSDNACFYVLIDFLKPIAPNLVARLQTRYEDPEVKFTDITQSVLNVMQSDTELEVYQRALLGQVEHSSSSISGQSSRAICNALSKPITKSEKVTQSNSPGTGHSKSNRYRRKNKGLKNGNKTVSNGVCSKNHTKNTNGHSFQKCNKSLTQPHSKHLFHDACCLFRAVNADQPEYL